MQWVDARARTMRGVPPATLEAAERLRNATSFELDYARGGGGSGGAIREGGMTTDAAEMRSANTPARWLATAAMVRKPLAQGAITRHAVAVASWAHDDAGGALSCETSIDMSMTLIPTIPGIAPAWSPAPGITHVVPSRASTSWSTNEKDSSKATSGERLISS